MDNPKEGLRQLEELLQELKSKAQAQVLFCLEHTGIYNHTLVGGSLSKAITLGWQAFEPSRDSGFGPGSLQAKSNSKHA